MTRFGRLNRHGYQHVRTLKQSDILACPFTIMMPEHYRDNGSCKCDDPEHRKYMVREWGYTEEDFTTTENTDG